MSKRTREAGEGYTQTLTPKKLRFSDVVTPTKSRQNTPSKRGRKPKNGAIDTPPKLVTPQSVKDKTQPVFITPTKSHLPKTSGTIVVSTNADRSARRKANRNLIQRSIERDGSDIEEDQVANEIWDEVGGQESEDSEGGLDDLGGHTPGAAPETPSKRGRGRPKGSKNKRTPTPPPNIPPHERYFFHNRSSAAKASSNPVSSQTLLSHAAYNDSIAAYKSPHETNISVLHEIHSTSFPLWAFELSQGYTVCLYGYGSKRNILTSFADFLHDHTPRSPPKTIIVNAHHPSLTIRNLLLTIVRSLDISTTGLSTIPSILLSTITSHQNKKGANAAPVYLLISTLNARALTAPPAPYVLTSLAAHPSIRLVLTASNPSFPLLWPSPMRDALNILFHDATTFLPYDDPSMSVSELGIGVVDSVAELMGKKGQTAASRERVSWVLKSLPENARGLYRILVSEILAAEADGLGRGVDNGLDSYDETGGAQGAGNLAGELPGIDSKVLYQKASEEFLCSSEMAFRGLLREFLDHAMVVVRRDGGSVGGGEILGIEMPKEELEGVLEDLVL